MPAEIKSVQAQATGNVAESCNSMTECRVKLRRSKTGKNGASSVKPCSIPPTSEAFTEHVHRCHLQVAIWKAALIESPPEMDSTKYDWELDHLGILVHEQCHLVHCLPYILQLIYCNCKPSGCRTVACSCKNIGCAIFCLREGAEVCKIRLTRSQTEYESEKTIENPYDDDL